MTVDRRRPILVNEGEFRTDAALREAAAELGYGVHAKVRLADALDIDRSGLSEALYGYALRAHLDWVVADLGTTRPEFAVEFDGESHQDDRVRRRDRYKDEVCSQLGLPLLRIDRAGFRPTIRRTVLYYLIESWGLMKAFGKAQKDGLVPADEVFDPWSFVDGLDEHGIVFRDMARPTRVMAGRLYRSGAITTPGPSHARRRDGDHVEALAWVETPDGSVVVGRARIRAYSFPAVMDQELAEDLAQVDLGARLARLTEGDRTMLEDPAAVSIPVGPGAWSGGGWLPAQG